MAGISILDWDSAAARSRFWSKVEKGDGCWLWKASICGPGYGQFFVHKGLGATGKMRPYCSLAHRAAWELTNGRIPEGLTIDHQCKVKLCVNPAHMEVVTSSENNRRADKWNRHKTCCPKGHPYDRVETWVNKRTGKTVNARRCDACRREGERSRGR